MPPSSTPSARTARGRTPPPCITGEVEVGDFCWSNELVLHVIEIKTNGPVGSLAGVLMVSTIR